MSSYARMLRLRETVELARKNQCFFTNEELDLILQDAQSIYTKEAYELIEELVNQLKEEKATTERCRCTRLKALCSEAVKIGIHLCYTDDMNDPECAVCGGCLIERAHAMGGCPGPYKRLDEISKEVHLGEIAVEAKNNDEGV